MEWSNPNFLNDPVKLDKFKLYANQDSKCLSNALKEAQYNYLDKYNVDICDVVITLVYL